jgi:hypothetical protein
MHATDMVGTMNMRCPDCQELIRSWLPETVVRNRSSEVKGWMLELTHESLDEAVKLAIAAAAQCWTPAPTGDFQRDLAGQIAEELIDHIRLLRRLEEFS